VNVGIVCYPSVGGSGVVATELGKALARRGHQVHVISTETPFRLGEYQDGLSLHQVVTPTYPLFREPQYLLSLANKIVQVAREVRLDIVHAHYAVPHAAAAFMAQQVIAAGDRRVAPRVITTLHGTDITLVGSDPSYSEIVAFSIERSDAVTAVSESLRASTVSELGVKAEIRVIPNFLDCHLYRRVEAAALRRKLVGGDPNARLVTHMSNFRPVKRIDAVIDVFDRIRQRIPARLLLVGDGPELAMAHRMARQRGIAGLIHAVGAQEEVVPLLSASDLFLLPSAQESFGLAALEAMACEVPVVASRIGGLPEVIEDGVSGVLHSPAAHDAMAESAIDLLTDRQKHLQVGQAARQRVLERYCAERIVPMYEACYEAVLQ
jgi:N-acetyl-alpha-D-glucosaminyl L-malate synthase BshA